MRSERGPSPERAPKGATRRKRPSGYAGIEPSVSTQVRHRSTCQTIQEKDIDHRWAPTALRPQLALSRVALPFDSGHLVDRSLGRRVLLAIRGGQHVPSMSRIWRCARRGGVRRALAADRGDPGAAREDRGEQMLRT